MEFVDLVEVVQSLKSDDAFGARLDKHQWRALSSYLAMESLRAGHSLLNQGEHTRTLYFLGEGHLQMTLHHPALGGARTELLRPGALVGESGLFCDAPNLATVEAMTAATVWALRLPRFEELSQRLPMLALEVMRGAGAVQSARHRSLLARIALQSLSSHRRSRSTAHAALDQTRLTQPVDLAA